MQKSAQAVQQTSCESTVAELDRLLGESHVPDERCCAELKVKDPLPQKEELIFTPLYTCCGSHYGYEDQHGREYDLDKKLVV